jgi:hypothetical protein
MFPPRTHSRQTFTPSPGPMRSTRDDAGSPYSWDGRHSPDGLMAGSALSSPKFDEGPAVPSHGIAPAFLGRSKAGYSLVPERVTSPGEERRSTDSATSYASVEEQAKGYGNKSNRLDDDERWIKRVELRDGPPLSTVPSNQSFEAASTIRGSDGGQATAGASRSGAISPGSEEGGSIWGSESRNTTPRAAKLAIQTLGETVQGSSPLGPPSRAIRPASQANGASSGTPKRMTKAQFDALQYRNGGVADNDDEEKDLEDDYEDDDEIERAKRLARQRQKNEANMAVYRQQMKKVTGGGPADLPSDGRPSLDRHSNSAPGSMLHLGGLGGTPPAEALRGKATDESVDDDVPLGILQAHNFPSAARPPTKPAETEAQRRASLAGSVVGGGAGQGNLPPFAKRLPADPYFGASLVNPANRESLAFSSSQSVYGGAPAAMPPQVQPPMGHPGGLVGIIAGEERAKAARRGSPNPITGTYNPLPSNMPPQAPGMPRTMSMGSIAAPQVYTPSGYMSGMPPMPGMPTQMPMMMPQQDQGGQQLQQFMQMQMQLMQNMLAMQQQQMGQFTPPAQQQQTPDYLGVQLGSPSQRPMSMASQAPFMNQNQGRAMTMMNPPPSWNMNPNQQRPTSAMPGNYAPSTLGIGGPGPGYTPSIAPSERSNVGQPSRYRPVSTVNDAPNGRAQSLTSSMTLQAFTNQEARPQSRQELPKSTIRIVDKPKGTPKVTTRQIDAEDDDDGWLEMAKKRSEKKFSWRKKEPKESQDAPALKELYTSLD